MKSRSLVALAVLGAALAAGCGRTEMHYVLSSEAREKLGDAAQTQLSESLDKVFGAPAAPHVTGAVAQFVRANDGQLAQGAVSYRRLCMHCHGLSGDGNGPTAGRREYPFLFPRPRDYRQGTFKFTSTPVGEKPRREDLLHTVQNGITGTSMPSFMLQYDHEPVEIQNVVEYVILLSMRGQTERFVVDDYQPGDPINADTVTQNSDAIAGQWTRAADKIVKPSVDRPTPEDPDAYAKSLDHGKELFLSPKVQCLSCHGREGRGDGWDLDPSIAGDPKKTRDDWGNLAKPADLTQPVRFRGGARPIDIFRRIHSGVKGTPMPAQTGNLSDADIWDLVNFVRTLAYPEAGQAVTRAAAAGREPVMRLNPTF